MVQDGMAEWSSVRDQKSRSFGGLGLNPRAIVGYPKYVCRTKD